MAGRAPGAARRDRRRPRRAIGVVARPPRPELRDGAALRAAQASAPGDLPGLGVHPAGLAFGAALRAGRGGAAAGQIGAAVDHRLDPRRDPGAHQPPLAGRGARREGRVGGSSPRRQHGDPYAHSGAFGQPAAARRRARADAAAGCGARGTGGGGGALPRSPPGGEAARLGDRVAARRSGRGPIASCRGCWRCRRRRRRGPLGRGRGRSPPPNTAICSPAWWIRRRGGCSRARRCRRRRRW